MRRQLKNDTPGACRASLGKHLRVNINFDKMVDLINEELVSAWDIMFWKRTSNPQSGEKYDHRNETYTL